MSNRMVIFASLIIFCSGCLAGFTGDTSAGEFRILNNDEQPHDVTIETNGTYSETVAVSGNGRKTLVIIESPGTYIISATVDGNSTVNETVTYVPGGPDGEELAGPGIVLVINPDTAPHIERRYD